MSKVEVKKGDSWAVDGPCLIQLRGNKFRHIADNIIDVGQWFDIEDEDEFHAFYQPVARAWIESLGGTVVEEREEEKGGGTVTAHLYQYGNGAIVMSSKRHNDFEETYKYLGITTIHMVTT